MSNKSKTIITMLIYFLIPILASLFLKYVMGYTLSSTNIKAIAYYNIALDIIFFVIILLINKDIIKNRVKFKDKNEFFKLLVLYTALFFVLKIISAIYIAVVSFLFGIEITDPNNQEMIIELFKQFPISMIITGAFLVPVTEELIFRGSIKRVINNKKLFIVISGLTFGLVHVFRYDFLILIILIYGVILDMIITSKIDKGKKIKLSIISTLLMVFVMLSLIHILSGDLIKYIITIDPVEALNSIVYIAGGVYLAYIYQKYDNIYLNIGCHMLNNFISYMLLFTKI